MNRLRVSRQWLAAVVALVAVAAAADTPADVSPEQSHWWSFQPVREVSLPSVKDAAWVRSPVDCFILAKLEERGLNPSPAADRRTLCRRVYFDLLGLPPSREELSEFANDRSEHAWARLVDRLLASPRYGERWGRHWMDVVRYADTAGDNADYPIPEAHLYRDYVIDAFNADKPYDEFVREQLAGDLLARRGPPDRYAEQVIATGFIALSRRYATAPFEFHHLIIEDSIETLGRTFLGMTFRCARCHDHKYDPVTKADYYGLYGLFASTRYPFAGSEEFESKKIPRTGFVPLVSSEEAAPRWTRHEQRLAAVRTELKQLEAAAEKAKGDEAQKREVEGKLKPLRAELRRLEMSGAPEGVPVAYGVTDDKPVDAPIQLRGEPDQLGPSAPRRPPRCLGGDDAWRIPDGASGRLEFAEWLTRPENPLTARVMVNRIWQHHFGRGLVGTASNFGLRGDRPTHPELLDYLAARFVASGWSVKAMQRLILESAVYQEASLDSRAYAMASEENGKTGKRESGTVSSSRLPVFSSSSSPAVQASESDPANLLLSRFPRRRLDAESIRDAMLLIAGGLDLSQPGAPPFPRLEDWHWTQHNHFKAVYESDHRSVFLMRQRIQRHPYLALFDAPDANVSTDVRTSATVPLQALYLMNNAFVQQQAAGFARRMLGGPGTDQDRIRRGCELAWSRPPETRELARAMEHLARYREELLKSGLDPEPARIEAWASYARVLLTANEFFYVD